MKPNRVLLAFALLSLTFGLSQCSKKKGNIVLQIQPRYGSQNLVINSYYTDPAGRVVQISLLQFYLSHISLVKSDNSTVDLSDVVLFDANYPSSGTVTLNNVSDATFKGVNFFCGLDSNQNKSNPINYAVGTPLSGYPSSSTAGDGMYWGMVNGDYRFEVLEGGWDVTEQPVLRNSFTYHVGYNTHYRETQLSHNFSVGEGTTTLTLYLDVEKIFNNPSEPIDIADTAQQVTNPTATDPLSGTFADDFSQAFTF